jgi:phenylalanyl-tRNA synthetase beta chain
MKLIYSHLKKFLPDLNVKPQQLRDDLTIIGHFANFFEKISDTDFLIDLDIKVNRGDCLGYYGLARDLSVYYQIPLIIPKNDVEFLFDSTCPIQINSADVYRILACKISGLKVNSSPQWLQDFLKYHEINSINNLVDISNYIMLLYGIPCHTFDAVKSQHLIWENNTKYSDFVSLDGTQIKLQPNNLIITNNSEVLSLSFIGGQNSSVDETTNETLVEMAVYNCTRVRRDSRSLKTLTEASTRLEKDLDPETIPLSFNHLVKLITDLCSGKISSSLFDHYPNPIKPPIITFDFQKPTQVAGIEISLDFSRNCLTRLGCTLNQDQIIPPTIRKDISIEADLVEEVIRFYGFQKIPTSQPLTTNNYPDITPKILYLIEKLKDDLVALGYDEVRTWPLVQKPVNPDMVIKTENAINSEYPYLRQSMIQSLQTQLDQYSRYKLPNPKFFEIGKIFSKVNDKYTEKYALGTYDGQNFVETILDDLPKPETYSPKNITNNAIELTSQIITLDANVNLDKPQKPLDLIKKYSALIDPKILWSMEIIDIYNLRYTFRVSYYNCDDKTAKKTHLTTFGLN